MLDLLALSDRIRNGGDTDLYRGILALDPRFPKTQEVSDTFMHVARVVMRLYPHRVQTQLVTSYDARIIVMEFCDQPATSRTDVLLVLGFIPLD